MSHFQNRKLFSAALLVSSLALASFSLTFSPNAKADEASCTSFADFFKRSYYITSISCDDLINLPAGKRVTLKDQEYSGEALAHMNGNPLVCGRDREIMKYEDKKLGVTRTTDIANTVFVKNAGVPAELLLPLLPKSLSDHKTLNDLSGVYLDAAHRASLGKKESIAQLKAMEKARKDFWSKGLASFIKDQDCAKNLCLFTAAVDATGAPTQECDQELKGKNWNEAAMDALFQKLQFAKAPAVSPIEFASDVLVKPANAPLPQGRQAGESTDPSSHNGSALKAKPAK